MAMTFVGAACGSGGGVSQASYCDKMKALPQNDEGPIAPIFTQYGDNPTLAQWAAFLPGAINEMKDDAKAFEQITPSRSLKAEQQAAIGALSKVTDNFTASQKA